MNIQDVIDTAIDRGSTDIVLTRKLYSTFRKLILIRKKGHTLRYRNVRIRYED
jgi:hypothetical protein